MQNKLIYIKCNDWIKSDLVGQPLIWDVIYGAYIPNIDYNKDSDEEKIISVLENWAGNYPDDINIITA